MSDIDWKSLEKIVAAIEKTLSPNAQVHHNVNLPVLGSHRTRQCDVIVKYGEHPRQSIAIIEVQKRKKKPDINTFHGWVQKMREVGAQHLFCVSAAGYPTSIIEEVATRLGPTVHLLTLSNMDSCKEKGGIFMLPTQIHRTPKWEIRDIGAPCFETNPANSLEFNTDAKCLSYDGNLPNLSLNDIICGCLNSPENKSIAHPIDSNPIEAKLTIADTDLDLWLHIQDNIIQIKKWTLTLLLTFETKVIEVPTTNLSYYQHNHEGALAWIGKTQISTPEGPRQICIIFKPDSDGYLEMCAIQLAD